MAWVGPISARIALPVGTLYPLAMIQEEMARIIRCSFCGKPAGELDEAGAKLFTYPIQGRNPRPYAGAVDTALPLCGICTSCLPVLKASFISRHKALELNPEIYCNLCGELREGSRIFPGRMIRVCSVCLKAID